MFDLITGEATHTPRHPAVPLLVATIGHVLIVGAIIAVPLLLFTEQLPRIPSMMAFVADAPAPPPPPPPPAPAVKNAQTPKASPSTPVPNPAAAPVEPPAQIAPEPPALEAGVGVQGGVEGGVPGGVVGGVVGGLPEAPPPPPPPPAPAPRGPVRIGGQIRQPTLITRVNPVYPGVAVSAHIEGVAILEAVVDEDGRVQEVRVLRSAHKLLDPAAIDAVRQWRYEPLKLNGINVRFVLTVTLAFRLQEAKVPVGAQS